MRHLFVLFALGMLAGCEDNPVRDATVDTTVVDTTMDTTQPVVDTMILIDSGIMMDAPQNDHNQP